MIQEEFHEDFSVRLGIVKVLSDFLGRPFDVKFFEAVGGIKGGTPAGFG